MEASYLPSVPFHAAGGHGASMGEMAMVSQQSPHHPAHHASMQAHGHSHHQFMAQSYPYHHGTAGSSLNPYVTVPDCIDYKDQGQSWKFQAL